MAAFSPGEIRHTSRKRRGVVHFHIPGNCLPRDPEASSQLNSMSIYGRRCRTPQCPRLSSHYCISILQSSYFAFWSVADSGQVGRNDILMHPNLNVLWTDKQYQHQQ